MRIALPHQPARRRGVERTLDALVELARGEALEIGALAAGDIDDLDVFAGAHEIGLRRRAVDADILQRIGERLGQRRLVWPEDASALDVHTDRRRRVLRAGLHRRTRRSHEQNPVAGDGELRRSSRKGLAAEQGNGTGACEIDAPPRKSGAHRAHTLAVSAEGALEPTRIPVGADAKNGGIGLARFISRDKLASLHALDINKAHKVAGPNRNGNDAPARDGVALLAGCKRAQARLRDDGGLGGPCRKFWSAERLNMRDLRLKGWRYANRRTRCDQGS